MTTTLPTQDLPPKGGFSKINYHHIPSKKYIKGWHLLVGFFGAHLVGLYTIAKRRHRQNYHRVEYWSAISTIRPVMEAEQDRKILKQLRINRDEEEKLMANVPGWEVGKYYDEPVFKQFDPNSWFHIDIRELYLHADPKVMKERADFHLYHI